MRKVCPTPGCPALIPRSARHCSSCSAVYEQTRGSAAARGYGTRHRAARESMRLAVEAGTARCWRCGRILDPREPWDAGHDDYDRDRYRGPECWPCNRATNAAGRKGAT